MNLPPSFVAPRYRGTVLSAIPSASDSAAMAVGEAPGGLLTVVGMAHEPGLFGELYVQRFTAEGQLDRSLGSTGTATLHFHGLQTIIDGGDSAIVLADGSVLVGGWGQSQALRSDPFVARLRSDGTADPAFGQAGFFAPGDQGVAIRAVAVDPRTQLIYAVGGFDGTGYRLYSLLPNGQPNPGFGADGALTLPTAGWAILTDLEVGPSGRVYVSVATNAGDKRIEAFGPDGARVASFGTDGRLMLGDLARIDGDPATMAVGADGALFVLGGVQRAGAGFRQVLLKLTPDGRPDPAWGQQGIAFGAADVSGEQGTAVIAVAADGSAFVLATVEQGGIESALVSRFDPRGNLDPAFGDHGTQRLFLGEQSDGSRHLWVHGLRLAADGELLLVGRAWDGDSDESFVARLDGLGRAEARFSGAPTDTSASSLGYVRGYPASVLNPRLAVTDPELAARAPGGDYGGASLHLSRSDGGPLAGGLVAVGRTELSGGMLRVDGHAVATLGFSGHQAIVRFLPGASENQVNEALRSLAFRTDEPVDRIDFDWRFDDGASGLVGEAAATADARTTVTLTTPTGSIAYWINSLLPRTPTAESVRDLVGPTHMYFVSFPRTAPAHLNEVEKASFVPASATQIDAVWSVLRLVESIADLHFVASDDDAAPRTLSYFNARSPEGFTGWARLPSDGPPGSDVSLDFQLSSSAAQFDVYAHETGHALGLRHPFDAPALPGWEDSQAATVMSYNRVQSPTYQALDIAALQFLYGPSRQVRTGTDTYRLDAFGANFIWDADGHDTIDGSSLAAPITLHLEPGHWDFIGSRGSGITAPGQITINFGTRIEAFVGGRGADTVFGDADRNVLSGGAGNDEIHGGTGDDTLAGDDGNDRLSGDAGDDRIDGGPGIDRAAYAVAAASVTIRAEADAWRVSAPGLGTDALVGVERVEMSDLSIALDLDGHAGQVARVLGAVAGRAAAANPTWVGIGLDALDAGLAYPDLARAAIEFRLGPQPSHAAVVDLLYTNVAGQPPGAAERDHFVGLLDRQQLTVPALVVLAADSTFTATAIDLVGLGRSGLPYLPVDGG